MKRIILLCVLLISIHSIAQEAVQKTVGEFKELKVYDLIWYKDIGGNRIIETTEKCPNEIKGIVTDFIKKVF